MGFRAPKPQPLGISRVMKRLILCLIVTVASIQSNAEGMANSYEVEYVRVDTSGLAYVNFKSALINEPASCTEKPGFTHALAFDTNTAGGKSILSVVLTAQASGKLIYALGTGLCDNYGVIEDWNYGWLK